MKEFGREDQKTVFRRVWFEMPGGQQDECVKQAVGCE